MSVPRALMAATALLAFSPRGEASSFEPMPALHPLNPCYATAVAALRTQDTLLYRIGKIERLDDGSAKVWTENPAGMAAVPIGSFRLPAYRVVEKVPNIPDDVTGPARSMMMATATYSPRRIAVDPEELVTVLEAHGLLLTRTRDANEMDGSSPTESSVWLPHYPSPHQCGVVGIITDK